MSETPLPPAAPPPAWQPGPAPAAAVPPQAQPVPAATRPPRLLTVWQAVVVGLACLVVGVGIGGLFGGLVGYAVGHNSHTVRIETPGGHQFNGGNGSGNGNGFGQGRPGMGQGGMGGQNGGQGGTQQTPPSAAPSTGSSQ